MTPPEVSEAPAAPVESAPTEENSLSSSINNLLDNGLDEPMEINPPSDYDAPEGDSGEDEGGEYVSEGDEDLPDFSIDPEEAKKGWSPTLARKVSRLNESLRAAREEAMKLRQNELTYKRQLEELRGGEVNLEQTMSKIKELEQRQMLTDLEATSVFQESVTEPLDNLVAQARDIADHYSIDHDELLDAMVIENPEEQEERLTEVLAGATQRDITRIFRIVEELGPIFERRAALFEHVEEALAEAAALEETRAQQEAAERAAERANVSRVVASRMVEKIPFLQEIDGLDLDSVVKKAADLDLVSADPVTSSFAALAAGVLPAVVRDYASLREENDSLVARLAAYEKAEPGSNYAGVNTDRVYSGDDDSDFAAALSRAISGGG